MARVRRDDHEDHTDGPAAARRAVADTRSLLERASVAWAASSCPASGDCCQLARTGRSPSLWPTEWAVIRSMLEEHRRDVPPLRADGACPFLEGSRCSIYAARPLGCRTYFCGRRTGPAEPVNETRRLYDELAAVNIALEPSSAPLSIERWVDGAAR